MEGNEVRRWPDWRPAAVDALHVAVLWAFAVAQPWFDVLRDSPAFFAIRGSEPVDIVVFAVGLVILPPLALLAVEALAGLVDGRLRRALHLGIVAVLVAAIALPMLEDLTGSGSSELLIPLAALVGAGAAVAYARAQPVRSLVTVLGPAPLLFLVLFLFFSPVTKLVTGGSAEAEVADVSSRTPVVMIVLDELPLISLLAQDGRIDAARYPNFARLARRSSWFRNASTVDSGTEHAVPAILDGRRPRKSAVPTFDDHPRNLFTLLGNSHRLHVTEPVTRLCPRELCRGRREEGFASRLRSLVSDASIVSLHLLLPDDVRDGLPAIDTRWGEFAREGLDAAPQDARRRQGFAERFAASERDRPEAVRRFAAAITPKRDTGRPPLHFLHAMFPHQPWQYLPSGRQYGDVSSRLGQTLDRWSRDPFGPQLHLQRHLLQVQFADRLVGQVIARLRRAGLFDRSLLVVTSDHGISFRPGERARGITRATAADIASVPLFVKAPRQRAGRLVERQVRTIDILPTIADVLGIRMPWAVDGRSALGGPGLDRVEVSEAGGRRHVFAAGWLRARRGEALRRQVALFGQGRDQRRLYGIGAHAGLLGRRLADLSVTGRGTAVRASINQALALSRVARRTGFVPAHVTGVLAGPGADATRDLALAVNGTVVAVTRTLPEGRGEFSFMVPEAALREGANRVQVLTVGTPAGRPALRVVGEAGRGAESYTLARGVIRSGDGRRIEIGRAVRGTVEHPVFWNRVLRLAGWAVQARTRKPVDRVLVFLNGRLVYETPPREVDAAIARLLGTDPIDLGWRAEIPRAQLRGRADVRVYAVAGSTASLLPFTCLGGRPRAPGCPPLTLGERSIGRERGSAVPIARRGVEGFVDRSAVEGTTLRVAGWAVRSDTHGAVDRVVAFARDRFLFAVPPEVPRTDIGAQFKTNPGRLGFQAEVPSRLLRDARDEVRVFALAGRAAVPLERFCPQGAQGC